MLLSVALTGCSKKTDDEAMENVTETASESTMTLTMYLMSESEVSEEQASKLEEAVNKITKSKFKTKLILKYFTEDQYTKALEEAFQKTKEEKDAKKAAEKALKEAIKRGEATSATTATGTTAEETIVNELGVTELKYPTVSENQVDIFYLGGYDQFMKYYNKGWIVELDENLSTDAKTLNSYIFGDYFKNIKFNTNDTCVIPNNLVIGEYTYMLLNKDVLAKYNYAAKNDFTSLVCPNVQDVLDKVARYNRDEYVPLWSGTGELDLANVSYIGVDFDEDGNPYYTNEFSLIGGAYNPAAGFAEENQYIPYFNVFNNSDFKSQLKTLVTYKENGYYAAEDEADKPFAVGYVKGTPVDVLQYADDYEIVVVEKPRMTTANAYDHCFAVSKDSSSTTRSMKIITYLNTNETFRNLLLYGIEGENYEIVEKVAKNLEGVDTVYKTVRKLNNDYDMALEKTGNVMLAYPLETDLPNIREYQKLQNREAVTALDFGFTFTYDDHFVNEEALWEARQFTNEIYAELLALDSVDAFNRFYNGSRDPENPKDSIALRILNNPCASITVDNTYSEGHPEYLATSAEIGDGVSLAFVYFTWLEDMGIYVEKEK